MVDPYQSQHNNTSTTVTRLPENVSHTYHRSTYAVNAPTQAQPEYGPVTKRQRQTQLPQSLPPTYPGPGRGIHIAPPSGGAGTIFNRPRPSPYEQRVKAEVSQSFEDMCKSFQEEEEEFPTPKTPPPTPLMTSVPIPRRILPQDCQTTSMGDGMEEDPYYHKAIDRNCSLEEAVFGETIVGKGKQEEYSPPPARHSSPCEGSGMSLEDEEAELERQKRALAQARQKLEQNTAEVEADRWFGAYHMEE